MSDFLVPLLMISMTTSLIVSIVLCVCRRKAKNNSSLNNVNNLLPLNSIRSSDLANNLELIRYNGVNCMTNDETDSHLRHTQRALPDIPSVSNCSPHLPPNDYNLNHESIEPNESQHNIEPTGRLPKSRAPQPPTHRVMTCPTVSTTDDLHHSYARIKDNAVIDSSENETDDYCDPHFCSPRGLNHNTDDMSPPVPTKRFANEMNTDLPFIPSLPSTSRPTEDMTSYLNQSPVLRINHSNIDSFSHLSDDENRMNGKKSEISYNTISVREPLAKVLAERANSEHHYNEVEEERVSSFYEEITGSATSSVTYSKIGDILSSVHNNSHLNHEIQDITHNGGPDIHSFALDTTDSPMAGTQQSFSNSTPNCDSFLANNYPKDLYSSVDKKSKNKSYNRQTIHCVPDSDNEFDNLYAKVQKQVNNSTKDNTILTNQRPSSVSDVDTSLRPDSSIPPPLPPPLSFLPSHSRSTRTISLYDSSNSVPNSNSTSHQRRYSSGNQSIIANDWHKTDLNNDYFNYGVVGNNEMDLENDPGYEVIHRKVRTTPISANHMNGIHSMASNVDPGYEAIRYDESDFDPNYETIAKKVNPKPETNETVDPGYEVIKKVPQIPTQTYSTTHFELNISRNLSDVSSEPGYERIRFTQRTTDEIESEPNYAFITRRHEFRLEDDEEEEETLSERL